MKAQVSSHRFVRLENFVESFNKREGENDVQTLERMLRARAHTGWEIVDVCGDELRSPTLIYRRLEDLHENPLYMIEEILAVKYKTEIDYVMDYLWAKLEEDWLPACVLDSPFMQPIAVLKKSKKSCADTTIKAIPVALDVFGGIANSIANELFNQQLRNNLTLSCIMQGGLHPILIMVSKETDEPYDYLVEHASGGFFKNQTTTLSDLIQNRSEEGWRVCGTFEDVFLWPCVVFRRETKTLPAVPLIGA